MANPTEVGGPLVHCGDVAFAEPESAELTMNRFSAIKKDAVTGVEQVWWNHAVMYLAMGNVPTKDIAELCGVVPSTINTALKLPQFQEKLQRRIQENGGTDVMALLKANAINATNVLIELVEDKNTSPAVRLSGVKEIYDRVMGKAIQTIVTDNTSRSDDPVAEVARLEAENERLRQQSQGGKN